MAHYKRLAKLQYQFFHFALAVVTPVKPLFKLALRLLTRSAHQVRGHILPLNVPIGTARQLSPSRDIIAGMIEQATALAVMNECLCRSVGGCTEYPVDIGCMVLGDAVHRLHPGLGRVITKEDALKFLDRALAHNLLPMVIHLHGDMLLWSLEYQRMLTICFCCPCHCFIREAIGKQKHPVITREVTSLPGVTVGVDRQKCIGCGRCVALCFVGAAQVIDGKATRDHTLCVACGRCAAGCPVGAAEVASPEPFDSSAVVRVYEERTREDSVFKRQ